MPNIRSAKKRVKVSATKTAANKARKSNLKTMIKIMGRIPSNHRILYVIH